MKKMTMFNLQYFLLNNKIKYFKFYYDNKKKMFCLTLPFFKYLFNKKRIKNYVKNNFPAGIAIYIKKVFKNV
jgi:hypothetical protein